MSGDEALDLLASVEPDRHKRIALLQVAVRDRRVKGRTRGIEPTRDRYANNFLVYDRDEIPTDNAWRRQFIYPDARSVDPAAFAAQSEFLHEDFIACFGEARRSPVAVPHDELVAFYRDQYSSPGSATNREDMDRAAQLHFGGSIPLKVCAAARRDAGVRGHVGRPRKSGK